MYAFHTIVGGVGGVDDVSVGCRVSCNGAGVFGGVGSVGVGVGDGRVGVGVGVGVGGHPGVGRHPRVGGHPGVGGSVGVGVGVGGRSWQW